MNGNARVNYIHFHR